MNKFIFSFITLFAGIINSATADYTQFDSRISACTRDAVSTNVNSWVNGSLPSNQNTQSNKGVYESLQKCGLFPSNLTSDKAELDLMFERSYEFKETVRLSVNLLNGQRITYSVIKKGEKYDVSEVAQEEVPIGPFRRLFGNNMSGQEKREVVERLLNDCKMANPSVLDTIDRSVQAWFSSRQVPSWKNNHQGYEKLFNDLKAQGIFGSDVQYKHSIFGRSDQFLEKQAGSYPQLAIRVGDTKYQFKVDPVKKSLIRPPSCDNSKVVQLRSILTGPSQQQGQHLKPDVHTENHR